MKKKPHSKHQWVFFDLDGTLADSIPAMYQVYLTFLKKFGGEGTREEFEELNGPALSEIIAILKARYKLDDQEPSLINFYSELIIDAYKELVKPMKGAESTLRALKAKGYSLSLVTSASEKTASVFIKSTGWSNYFQACVFGDEVKKAKPFPEIYNHALKKVNASCARVIAVEDSYNGVQAAKKAGMFVLGFANEATKDSLAKAGADTLIFQLQEILPILNLSHELHKR